MSPIATLFARNSQWPSCGCTDSPAKLFTRPHPTAPDLREYHYYFFVRNRSKDMVLELHGVRGTMWKSPVTGWTTVAGTAGEVTHHGPFLGELRVPIPAHLSALNALYTSEVDVEHVEWKDGSVLDAAFLSHVTDRWKNATRVLREMQSTLRDIGVPHAGRVTLDAVLGRKVVAYAIVTLADADGGMKVRKKHPNGFSLSGAGTC